MLRQIQSGNDDAMECLLERYRDMVRKEARKFFLAGGDEEDLMQEGMIGLFKAVTSYQEEKNTSFSTFAYLCVQRQIYTTITAFNRKKTYSVEYSNLCLNKRIRKKNYHWMKS